MSDNNRIMPKGVIIVGSISIMFGILGLLLATLQVAVFSMIAQEQDIILKCTPIPFTPWQ